MQNRYSGDIGDYSKFVLLRKLFSAEAYRIGLVWYLHPDETHSNDGRHIDYLEQPAYLDCDADLIQGLSKVTQNQRHTQALQAARLLPNHPVYFSEPLDFHLRYPGRQAEHRQQRRVARSRWLQRAVQAVSDCNVVVLDPDNGLEIESCRQTHQGRAGKYAYYHEVEDFYRDKAVCVIYQHLHRRGSHQDQMRTRAQALKQRLSSGDRVFAIRYAPYTPRAYLMIASAEAATAVRASLEDFTGSLCGAGWDSYYEV